MPRLISRTISVLTAVLVLGGGAVGTAQASADRPTADLTFAAFGTGDTTAAAKIAAVKGVFEEEATFIEQTGARCSLPLSLSTQQFQLLPSGYGEAVTIGVYCGAPAPTRGSLTTFYAFVVFDTQLDAAEGSLLAAYENEVGYTTATGATCVDNGAPDTAQPVQVAQGWVSVGEHNVDCQAAGSSS